MRATSTGPLRVVWVAAHMERALKKEEVAAAHVLKLLQVFLERETVLGFSLRHLGPLVWGWPCSTAVRELRSAGACPCAARLVAIVSTWIVGCCCCCWPRSHSSVAFASGTWNHFTARSGDIFQHP
mmetsp:Transcript_37320/g.68271  ORF Transcript_37320/g.68271 Transcript_37320/m.68271 type:complete len:126 (+) Transcript_37320:50-427(+)